MSKTPCEASDPDLWYADEDTVAGKADAALAKSFCRTCPVQAKCLETALAVKQPFGIWGGMSWPERERILRAEARGRLKKESAA